MRSFVVAAVIAAGVSACSPDTKKAPVTAPAVERASTFDVAFVDMIDGAPATHIAVGGKLRVRVPDAQVTSTTVVGSFSIMPTTADTLAITPTGAGTGVIEIETLTGFTRIAVSAAPIDGVAMVFDPADQHNATIVLRDARGKRLVDASLRIAPGSAAVTLRRDAWDHVVFQSLPPGPVLIETDLLGTTKVTLEKIATRSLAQR